MEKCCNKCKKIKNVSEFYRRNDYSPLTIAGYRYSCIPCDKAISKHKRKNGLWKQEEKRTQRGSRHSILKNINSQKHRDEMSDMYIRSLMTKKSKTLKSKDIPKELIEQYRVNLILKRELRKIKEKR